MKYFATIFTLLFIYIAMCNQSYALEVDKRAHKDFFVSFVELYNDIVSISQNNIQQIMEKLLHPVSNFLSALAVCWIIGTAIRCFMNNTSVLNAFLSKISLLIVLHLLLSYTFFHAYILSNLLVVFNNLPTYVSNLNISGGESIMNNIFDINSKALSLIFSILDESSFSVAYIFTIICSLFTIISIFILTIQIILTALIATIKFNLVLSLSSIWILLFFFKTTRNISLQAINILIACICQMCFLVAILGLTNEIYIRLLNELLVTQKNSLYIFSGIIGLCVVDIFLIKEANTLASHISSVGSMSMGSDMTKSISRRYRK